jgi:transcriptional regulator with XRE-family HTH domain
MDMWPQRDRFKEIVRGYQKATGLSQEEVADAMGVARSSLRFWMYQRRRRPSFDVLKSAAAVLGCSVMEFVDDPGQARVPGVERDAWAGSSERDRVIAQAMFSDITSEDLTEEDKDMLYAAWREEVAKFRKYKLHYEDRGEHGLSSVAENAIEFRVGQEDGRGVSRP